MRIHCLIVDNVRAVEHLELRDLPGTGVILIHGENEAGKSTILDALDAVLNLKHTSAKIRALNPIGRDEIPAVTLGATVGPYTFTIYKRFAKGAKGKSELKITSPAREEHTGEAAHNRLTQIISEHLDDKLFEALFLRQGEFTAGIEAAGIPTFARALEQSGGGSETGTQSPGLEDSGLMQRVEQEYLRFFTPTGAPKQDLKKVDADVLTAEEAVKDAREKKTAYEAVVDEYARCNAEKSAAEADLPAARAELAAREADVEAAQEFAVKAASAQQQAQRAASDVEHAKHEVEHRAALSKRVELAEEELAVISEQLAPAEVKAAAEEQQIAEKTAEYEASCVAAEEASTHVAAAQAAVTAAKKKARVRELTELVARLDDLDAEITRLVAQQPERVVTDDDVRALEEAVNNVAFEHRIADAAAARMDITTETATSVAVDGTFVPVSATQPGTVPLHAGTVIAVGDVTLTYHPAHGAEVDTGGVEAAERVLADVVARLGCDSVEAARTLRDDHRDTAAALSTARARRADVLGGDDASELRAELTRLEQASSTDSGEESEATDGIRGEALSVGDAERALSAARETQAQARDAAHILEVQLAPLRQRPAAVKLVDVQAQMEKARSTADSARADLKTARGKRTDSDVHAAYDAATTAHQEAVAAADAIAKEAHAVDLKTAESLLAGARNRVENLTERFNKARDRSLQLESRVRTAEGEAENLDHAEAAVEVAQMRRDRLHRQADAVKLLRTTLIAHRDEARKKYAKPFADALQRYASRIFGPGTQFTLDDSLRVTARTVNATTVDVNQLSGGAKEQMALLTRFAIADLVAGSEAGAPPVPVIVDDALGATDPARLELMNTLFTDVGESSQVFVLTCFPQRFDRVRAAKTASIQELSTWG